MFSVPPFQFQQLEKPGIRTILNSFDVMDGPHTFTVAWTSARFRDKNPVLYKALIAALKEATEIVDKDRQESRRLLDRGREVEDAARQGDGGSLRPAGEVDDGAARTR